jgi:hypothetical protein
VVESRVQHLPTPADFKDPAMTAEQGPDTCDPRNAAFAESAAHLAGMLRGLVSRWETVDFSVSASCLELDERILACNQAGLAESSLPAAYSRL